MAALCYRLALTVMVMLVTLSLHAAPCTASAASHSIDPDKIRRDRQTYFTVLEALMQKLQDVRKKRTRPDGGFFSRHDAMNDYLQSAYANELAMDMYGPGKRK